MTPLEFSTLVRALFKIHNIVYVEFEPKSYEYDSTMLRSPINNGVIERVDLGSVFITITENANGCLFQYAPEHFSGKFLELLFNELYDYTTNTDEYGECEDFIARVLGTIELSYNPDEFFKLGDSMCYDSGICVLTAQVHINGKNYEVTIETQGHVKVFWHGEMYKHASQMPEELIDAYYNGTIDTDDDYEVCENNWWEIFVFDDKHELLHSDVLDCEPREFKDEQELIDTIREWVTE